MSTRGDRRKKDSHDDDSRNEKDVCASREAGYSRTGLMDPHRLTSRVAAARQPACTVQEHCESRETQAT